VVVVEVVVVVVVGVPSLTCLVVIL